MQENNNPPHLLILIGALIGALPMFLILWVLFSFWPIVLGLFFAYLIGCFIWVLIKSVPGEIRFRIRQIIKN